MSNSCLYISHPLQKCACIFTACILCIQTSVYAHNNDDNAFQHLRIMEWASDCVYVCMNGVPQVTSVSEIHKSSHLHVSLAWHNYIISVTSEHIFYTEYEHYYILRHHLPTCIGYVWMSYLALNTYHFRHIKAIPICCTHPIDSLGTTWFLSSFCISSIMYI
jgi:hypothetical protein